MEPADIPTQLPEGVDITKIIVSHDSRELNGLRLQTFLSNGESAGRAENYYGKNEETVLEPGAGKVVVGFFGRSDWGRSFEGIQELGIIITPEGISLPDVFHDMKALKNTDGGVKIEERCEDDESEEMSDQEAG